jgi:hypothetical protein
MTVAKMHKQRKVVRGRYIPRFSRQRKIKRGGGDTGGTPPAGGVLTLTSVTPSVGSVGGPVVQLNFIGTGFFGGGAVVRWSGLFGFPADYGSSLGFIVDTPTTAHFTAAGVTAAGIHNEAGVSDFKIVNDGQDGTDESNAVVFTVT